MARAGLRFTVRDLAEKALVAPNTVCRFEAEGNVETLTVRRLQAALEAAGVIFLVDDGQGDGVRVVTPKA